MDKVSQKAELLSRDAKASYLEKPEGVNQKLWHSLVYQIESWTTIQGAMVNPWVLLERKSKIGDLFDAQMDSRRIKEWGDSQSALKALISYSF